MRTFHHTKHNDGVAFTIGDTVRRLEPFQNVADPRCKLWKALAVVGRRYVLSSILTTRDVEIQELAEESRGWEWYFLKGAVCSGAAPQLFEGHNGAVHSVVIPPDNSRLLSAGWDSIRQWNLRIADAKTVLADQVGAYRWHWP